MMQGKNAQEQAARAFLELAFAAQGRLAQKSQWSAGYKLLAYQMERGWGMRAERELDETLYPSRLLTPEEQTLYQSACQALCAARSDGDGYAALRAHLKELGLGAQESPSGSSTLWMLLPDSGAYAKALGAKEAADCERLALRRWRSQEEGAALPRAAKKRG